MDIHRSTQCPHCGDLAIRGTQMADETLTEECECPSGHVWRRLVNDPFPESPTYEELAEMHTSLEEFDNLADYAEANREWYNTAPFVAARLIVLVARQHEEFRKRLFVDDRMGTAHAMAEYDEEMHRKLNEIGLSAFQGGSAENMARSVLEDDGE